jgi:hypothetical protein
MKLLAAAFAALLLVTPAVVVSQNVGHGSKAAVPATPAPVKDILYVRRFTLGTPYANTWSKERATVASGVLVVLEVDPAYVDPRDAALNPVLYAGDVTVIRLNHGDRSGRVIGIIPGDVDLATAPIWFGSPELPERVTPAVVRSERARAEKAGVRPLAATKIAGVERPAVAAADLAALLRDVAAQLVYEYSPREKHLADAWRLPQAKATPRKTPN